MESLLLEPNVTAAAAARDQQRLQGTWSFVAGIRPAQLLIAGSHFTMTFGNGTIYMGTFRVDPTHKPRAMDMVVEEGPDRHRGKTALCIYEFDGERLIWAPAEPGVGGRPQAFPPLDDPLHLCLVFRHEKHRHGPA